MVSITAFVICRCVLALGEAGNFPAAIKATAEYFPKKDRAFATGIFNSGANVGAILAPLTVPVMAEVWGWETAFLVVGAIGFVWLGFWQFIYKSPENNPRMNAAERAYIEQDQVLEAGTGTIAAKTANGSASVGVMGVPMVDKGAGMTAEVPAEEAVADKMTIWAKSALPADLGFCGGKIPDRRRLVVFPVLDSGLPQGAVRYDRARRSRGLSPCSIRSR